ncbi:MAG: tRNA (adenosine(37)-N6)-threonylcarbamoyltransferase complex ATPase subunit type 1 TsaE [Oscillospiraceae bacterium]
MLQKYFSNSVEQTEKIACDFAKTLKKGDVIAYSGDLGAGKTAFTRGLAQGLNIQDEISSPTFALVHEYQGEIPLYHFDMYRINSLDDVYSTGFFDYLEQGGILAVEWSENILPFLEDMENNLIKIDIKHIDENSREIFIERND